MKTTVLTTPRMARHAQRMSMVWSQPLNELLTYDWFVERIESVTCEPSDRHDFHEYKKNWLGFEKPVVRSIYKPAIYVYSADLYPDDAFCGNCRRFSFENIEEYTKHVDLIKDRTGFVEITKEQ